MRSPPTQRRQLLPLELGQCQYAEGVDAQIVNTLTDPEVVSLEELPRDWNSRAVLQYAANNGYLALIDTGALVTGYSNMQVAQQLLSAGLHGLDGVVFLDCHDRQMILLREGMKAVPLKQCGLPPHKRFSFYDQVHTTGVLESAKLPSVGASERGGDGHGRGGGESA